MMNRQIEFFYGVNYHNCMLIPTIYFCRGKITFEVSLRFMRWGVGFFVYALEGMK